MSVLPKPATCRPVRAPLATARCGCNVRYTDGWVEKANGRPALMKWSSGLRSAFVRVATLNPNCINWEAVIADPPTTITVRTSTLRSLSLHKAGRRSHDDVLRDLMEEVPPESFLRWAKAELKQPTQSLARVRKHLKLSAR